MPVAAVPCSSRPHSAAQVAARHSPRHPRHLISTAPPGQLVPPPHVLLMDDEPGSDTVDPALLWAEEEGGTLHEAGFGWGARKSLTGWLPSALPPRCRLFWNPLHHRSGPRSPSADSPTCLSPYGLPGCCGSSSRLSRASICGTGRGGGPALPHWGGAGPCPVLSLPPPPSRTAAWGVSSPNCLLPVIALP